MRTSCRAPTRRRRAPSSGRSTRTRSVRVVVYTQRKPEADTLEEATADAHALGSQWRIGGSAGNGIVLLFELGASGREGIGALAAGTGCRERFLDENGVEAMARTLIDPMAESGDIGGATLQVLTALVELREQPGTSPSGATASPGASAGSPRPSGSLRPGQTVAPGGVPGGRIPPAGPPYPQPIENVTVYDYAEVLEPATEATLTSTIAAIEQRTGAEVVVYTQVKPESDTTEEAERDARALIDQWGIGRKGFDDGLAILFDMDIPSGTTARSSCTPRRATGPRTSPTASDRRSSSRTCCPGCGPATWTAPSSPR